jgi:hypothetical protein
LSDGFTIVDAAGVPAASLSDAFNAAFSDYLISFPKFDGRLARFCPASGD